MLSKKSVGFIFICLLLAACSEKKETPAVERTALSKNDSLTDKLKAKISRDLNDPGSVQFRNLKLGASQDGENLLCGELNEKNQYGGYSGFRWFAVLENHGGKILDSSSLAEDQMKGILNDAGCAYPISAAKD